MTLFVFRRRRPLTMHDRIDRRTRAGARGSLYGPHPKMVIQAESGETITVPYAPEESNLDGVAPDFTVVPRAGRAPLTLRVGDNARVISFDLMVAYPDHQESVEPILQRMRVFARAGQRMRITLDHTTASNLWRWTGFEQTVTRRQHGTNAPTRALVTCVFTAALDPIVAVGPLTGGTKPTPPPPPKPSAPAVPPPRTYTVKKGDWLSKIAQRFYGDAKQYRKIADANKIANPNKIYPGQVLKIP